MDNKWNLQSIDLHRMIVNADRDNCRSLIIELNIFLANYATLRHFASLGTPSSRFQFLLNTEISLKPRWAEWNCAENDSISEMTETGVKERERDIACFKERTIRIVDCGRSKEKWPIYNVRRLRKIETGNLPRFSRSGERDRVTRRARCFTRWCLLLGWQREKNNRN